MRLIPLALAAAACTLAVASLAAAREGARPTSVSGESTVEARATRQVAMSAHEAARAERFLEARAGCRGCHRIAGRGGQIGPSLEGLGARAAPDYIRNVIRDPTAVIPGTLMPRQSMPEAELDRLVAYLLADPQPTSTADPLVTPEPPPTLDPARRGDGPALYARHCAACHGPEGRGDGWNAPNLPVQPTSHTDATLMSARTDDSLFDAIHAGAFVLDGSPRMPPFGEMLAVEQIRALVAHIRTLCSCEEPSWAGR
jgi:mono/diheme cytochrome c family protein